MEPTKPLNIQQIGAYALRILNDLEKNKLSLEDGISIAANLLSFILIRHKVSKETTITILADIKNSISAEVIRNANLKKRPFSVVRSNPDTLR